MNVFCLRSLFIVCVAVNWACAAPATITGNLYDLEKLVIDTERIAIRVIDFNTNTIIRVNDISDPVAPRPNLTVVDRRDGTFTIEIPIDGRPLRIISIAFRRPDRAELDTQELRNIVIESGKSYTIDTTV